MFRIVETERRDTNKAKLAVEGLESIRAAIEQGGWQDPNPSEARAAIGYNSDLRENTGSYMKVLHVHAKGSNIPERLSEALREAGVLDKPAGIFNGTIDSRSGHKIIVNDAGHHQLDTFLADYKAPEIAASRCT